MTYTMDDGEKLRLEEKARADAKSGIYVTPFDLINGSAIDKARKTEFNRVYAAAHGGAASSDSEVTPSDDIDVLRSIYAEQFGKPADKRKSVATLKEELGL